MSRRCSKCDSADILHDTITDQTTSETIHVARCAACGAVRALRLPPSIAERDVVALGQPTPTGFRALDEALAGGFLPGLAVFAAPTGVGKTTYLTQQADQIAATGRPVVLVAAEPSADEERARLAAPRLGRSWRDVRIEGAHTSEMLAGIPIYVVRDVPQDPVLDDIRICHGTEPVIVVDHLHAIARRVAAGSDVDTRRALGMLTQTLADLAEQRRTVVIAAAQVARSWYSSQSQDDRPKSGRDYVAAAKDAGEIEADASYLLYLDVEGDVARVHVAKARCSPSDIVVEMRVDLARGQYSDVERDPLMAAIAAAADAGTGPSRQPTRSRKGRDVATEIVEIIRERGPKPRGYLVKCRLGRAQTVYDTITQLVVAGTLVETQATGTTERGRTYRYPVLALPDFPALPGSAGSSGSADSGSAREALPNCSIYTGDREVPGSDEGQSPTEGQSPAKGDS